VASHRVDGRSPLWGRPARDLDGALTVLAWIGCLGYAAYYSGLDAVAGTSAGTVAGHGAYEPLTDSRPGIHRRASTHSVGAC